MGVYRGCEIPDQLHYDVEHDVWVRIETGGEATLGMTDPAQSRCGKLVSVRFKKVGRKVLRGESLATIESAKWVGPFPAPLSGEIVATNEAAFRADILVANKDPYGAGWLVRLRPSDLDGERSQLQSGPEAFALYQARILEMKLNCFRCAEGGHGPD